MAGPAWPPARLGNRPTPGQRVSAKDPSLKKNDLGHVLPVSRPAYRDRVADWTGEGRNTAELYLGMAVHELHGVSPSYEALCRAVAGSEPICALLDRLPRTKRQPNLLLGAVRFLGGPVDDPASFLKFVTARWGAVADTMMAHRTQTNEPGRCATLLPLLASLPQPWLWSKSEPAPGCVCTPTGTATAMQRAWASIGLATARSFCLAR